MTTVIVHHTVADFDTWLPFFQEHGATRQRHGCTSEQVLRAAGDPNAITAVLGFPSLEAAQAFASDPSLKETMGKAGVVGAPDIRFLEDAPVAAGAAS